MRELSQGRNTGICSGDTSATPFIRTSPQTNSGSIECYSHAEVQGQNTHSEKST